MEAVLPFLAILICPLMMIFMMGGHGGGHCDHKDHKHDKGGDKQ